VAPAGELCHVEDRLGNDSQRSEENVVANVNDVKLVAAVEASDGSARFLDDLKPFDAGTGTSVKLWRFEGGASIPGSVGGVPADTRFTGPGGATFQAISFPARFTGATAQEMQRTNPSIKLSAGDDPGMHSTDTIDMGFVVSGKVDLKLPGGEIRTLEPGTAFVIAGARHAWANPYDEPCLFSNVIVGVDRPS
jgi:Cupin domain